jgi:cytochrome P450
MDTTAHSLSFVIYALARYPEIQFRCQQEVDQWLSSQSSTDTLPPYVEAVMKEAMRKWPTAGPGSMRQVRDEKGVQLTPTLHVPKDWWILISIYALHHSKEIWGDDVEEFIPERWLEKGGSTQKLTIQEDPLNQPGESVTNAPTNSSKSDSIDWKTADNTYLASAACYAGSGYSSSELAFLPFSHGLRNCVGMNLALLEMRITLLKLISMFHFDLGDEKMKDDENVFETVFTLRPCNGCPIRVSCRK